MEIDPEVWVGLEEQFTKPDTSFIGVFSEPCYVLTKDALKEYVDLAHTDYKAVRMPTQRATKKSILCLDKGTIVIQINSSMSQSVEHIKEKLVSSLSEIGVGVVDDPTSSQANDLVDTDGKKVIGMAQFEDGGVTYTKIFINTSIEEDLFDHLYLPLEYMNRKGGTPVDRVGVVDVDVDPFAKTFLEHFHDIERFESIPNVDTPSQYVVEATGDCHRTKLESEREQIISDVEILQEDPEREAQRRISQMESRLENLEEREPVDLNNKTPYQSIVEEIENLEKNGVDMVEEEIMEMKHSISVIDEVLNAN